MTPPGSGQEGPGGVVEADQLLLVELVGVDVLLEELDVLLAHVVERTAVVAVVVRAAAATPAWAHGPPPAAAPTGRPCPWACACGPAPSPVAMLNAPEPWRRALWPRRITSGRV